MTPSVDSFFALARERHAVYLRRAAGQPPPWTEDPIFAQYRFTNVFRENDRTTKWFREHVRDPLRDKPEVLLATVVFRLFNRITTGEAIFQQPYLDGQTAWELFLESQGDPSHLHLAISTYCGSGPYVTGAFIVKTPLRMPKLDGVLWMIEQFATGAGALGTVSWRSAAEEMLMFPSIWSLQKTHQFLCQFPYIGDFQAYEIVTDLRHTALLDQAPDINTWASAGPGARKGLEYIYGKCGNRAWQEEKMRELLEASRDFGHWPQKVPSGYILSNDLPYRIPGDWPAWELREVEMWLCECAKYWRVAAGGHRPKQRYRYA